MKQIDGKKYYTTQEVCQKVGISRSTLWRWQQKDLSNDAKYRDRNKWRLWTEKQVEALDEHFNAIYPAEILQE